MRPFRESFMFYINHLQGLLLLSLTIVLPFLVFQTLVINNISLLSVLTGSTVLDALATGFFTLLFLVIAQLPFIQYVLSYLEGEERPIRKAYRTFFTYGFSVFLFGITYTLAVFIGFYILIIPGIIILVLFYLTPYMTVWKQQTTQHTCYAAFQLGKSRFFPLLGLLLLSAVVETGVSLLGFIAVSYMTLQYSAFLIIQMFVNVCLFPLFVVLITFFFSKWQEASVAEGEGSTV